MMFQVGFAGICFDGLYQLAPSHQIKPALTFQNELNPAFVL
jgi:hypothetical protein